MEVSCRGEGLQALASSCRHPQTSPPPASRPQHTGPSCQERTETMRTNHLRARPPNPLSKGDAYNEGMAPEHHSRTNRSFGFSPEIERFRGKGEGDTTSMSPSRRRTAPAASSTSWMPPSVKGFPHLEPTSSHTHQPPERDPGLGR
jgi:hypothetical protein